MNEFELKPLLERIIRRVLQEEGLLMTDRVVPLPQLYCICNETWDCRYYRLRDELNAHSAVHAIVLGDITTEYHEKLKQVYPFSSVRDWNMMEDFRSTDKIILPVLKRDDVIQIAQGYSMSPMAGLVRKAFEAGVKIYILPYSLERLTGREPKLYQDKILAYHKELFNLGIEYIKSLSELKSNP